MGATLGPQATNTTRVYRLDLYDGDNVSLANRGVFTGSETFSAKLTEGYGLAPLASLTAAWFDSSLAQVNLTVTTATIAALAPGYYPVQVILNPGSSDVEAFSGQIRLTEATSTGVAAACYCLLVDLVRECAWIEDMEALGPGLQAGLRSNFLDQRLESTDWLNRIVMARVGDRLADQARRHGPVAWIEPILPTAGYDGGPAWGPSILPDKTLQLQTSTISANLAAGSLLPAGNLLQDAEDRNQARRIAARYALYLVLRHQPGGLKDGPSYLMMAQEFRREAIRLSVAWTARIDTDADGVADYELPA